MTKTIGRLKTKYWKTSVAVTVHDDLGEMSWGAKRTGTINTGWVWPFSILRPGTIKILKGFDKDLIGKRIAAHELQHINDQCSPLRWFRKRLMRNNYWYWLEVRGEVMELIHTPLRDRVHYLQRSIDRLKKERPAFSSQRIDEDIAEAEADLKVDVLKTYREALPHE